MKVLHVMALVCLMALLAVSVYASDADFGGFARSVAMGGAGLALSDNAVATTVINPAAGAASGTKMRFVIPSLDYATKGTTVDELRSRTNEISDTGTDDAIKLAEDFGEHQTKLSAGLMTGFVGGYGVTLEGEAQGLVNPGANFQNWVTAGHPTTPAGLLAAGLVANTLPATIAAYAATLTTGTYVTGRLVYDAPSITYGKGFSAGEGKLWIGGKAKFIHSEVQTWDIASSVSGSDLALDAVERPKEKDNGFGMDLGFIYQPVKSKVQYGMVIDNFIEPNLKGIDAAAMWSVGAACRISPKILVASDIVNFNKANSMGASWRTGVEWQVMKSAALRCGYSGKSFTWGFSALGMDFAFSSEAPNMISRTLAF